jgi:uncharacterized protein
VTPEAFRAKYGPWAIVTGASEGIGYAFAEQLSAVGLNVVIVARRSDRLHALQDMLRHKYATSVRIIASDLSTAEGLAQVEQGTADLDVGLLVAAAGFGTSGPLLASDLEREHEMLALNCFAVLRQCRVFGARLAARGSGGIILLSSLVGWQGVPWCAHYAATKSYVQTLAEGLAVELGSQGVNVLAVAPGPVESGFAAHADMRMGATVQPAAVARASLRALGRKGTAVPGALSKLLTYSLLPLPRRLRTLIMGSVMGGMTKHQRVTAG